MINSPLSVVCRTSNLRSDSRAQRIVLSQLSSHRVTYFGLTRGQGEHFLWSPERHFSHKLTYRLLSSPGHGGGYTIIWRLLFLQLNICFYLLKNRSRLVNVICCDLDSAFLPSLICCFLRINFIYDVFDFTFASRVPSSPHFFSKFLKGVFSLLELLVCLVSKKIILPTSSRLEQLPGLHKFSHKVSVVPNSPCVDQLTIKEPEASKINTFYFSLRHKYKIIITYVGTLQHHRNLDWLLNAVASLDNVCVVVAGTGPLYSFFRDSKQKNMFFRGQVIYNHALHMYHLSDFMFAGYTLNDSNNFYAAPNKLWESVCLRKRLLLNSSYIKSNIPYADHSLLSLYSSQDHLRCIISNSSTSSYSNVNYDPRFVSDSYFHNYS
ncbi:UDP-glycosyltransferase/glycogen phosphorylase [Synechococcus sp. RS9909]|nr:UDP-glycosyltransferase/glycogen phosphorylase [Synechococcus sp. RS9909]